MSLQKAHHAYAVTGAMGTVAAAVLTGTIPAEYLDDELREDVILSDSVGLGGDDVTYTDIDRTARQIMCGDLFYSPCSAAIILLTAHENRKIRIPTCSRRSTALRAVGNSYGCGF